METIILKIILCSGIVLGLYYLFLEKEKTFTFNRFYLLLGLIFSYSIPLVTIETLQIENKKSTIIFEQGIQQQIVQNPVIDQAKTFDYSQLFLLVYFIICGFFVLKIMYSIVKIKLLKGRKITYQNRTVILLSQEIAPFSFLNIIYLSENYYNDGKIDDRIFLHEEIHVTQKHSFDVLLIEFIKAFSWFNPFIYFYKNAMITNHEFLADEEVILKNNNIKNYQELILNEVLKKQNLPLTHQFNFNNTKKKLIMMTKRNSKFAEAKKYLAIPLFVLLAGFFVDKVYAQDYSTKKTNAFQNVFADDPFTEYNQVIKKYGNLLEQKKYGEFHKAVSNKDRAKLKELYFQLTKEQRNETPLYFFDIPEKSAKIKVTQSQLNDFADSKKYGLWIDGKKARNQDIRKYKPQDFSNYFISKRYPNAISAKNPEPFQVNVMTNAYYQKYLKKEEMIFMGFKPKAFIKGKDTITQRKATEAKVLTPKPSTNQDLSIPPPPSANFIQAEFPGGANSLRNKVSGVFDGSVFKGDEGTLKTTVYIGIDEQGTVDKIFTSGDNEKFNFEAERAVKVALANEKWKPATNEGNLVRTTFSMPLIMSFAN
ncbi:hypothetical protein CHRY9390_01539 [Chryseobacterium aquaeductus]|uniref:Peptidase M56 domain-containing protein n=1 Tax=Chryseobacterium aquaeductus TaxID=2675056 RepID=A0A9N8QQJ1_9FLAO|nr:M56 family metallopeptidase [Chryseobacterium aquaeductus]CAA7330866.1 hypothetical protein CHRY9390_01539 [Chryseobacterium potabilaquae]CAD7806639.1 hypothetical protein CHRY9390_01539 [Chryseobacterium aquaeductus]